MLIIQHEKPAEGIGRSMPLTQLDAAAVGRAREIFADYRQRGVVLGGSFDDTEWKLSNEASNVTFSLLVFADGGNADAPGWTGVSESQYSECLKAYIALKLGDLSLSTLQNVANTLAPLVNVTADAAAGLTHDITHIAEFLSLLPGDSVMRDRVVETLEERIQVYRHSSGADSRRVLAAFNSYLRFSDALSEFWGTADDEAKLFYFPVYFWWNLTSILPLRPTEFLLTPRDCLDGNILTVRRTRLKGSGGSVNYRVAQDYKLHRYEITPALAAELNNYLARTEHMPGTELDTLLRLEPHYTRLRMGVSKLNRYYTYNHMRTCLAIFLAEAADSDCANTINLGDTRHLAMVSLIISGGSPSICKELAGHANIDISSHYYTNFSNLVECVTIGRFRKSKRSGAEFAGKPSYPLARPCNMVRLTDGWCDSDALKNGEVGDCMKVVDDHGRIGECSACDHFWSGTPGMRLRYFDESEGKQRVDLDSAFLMRMISLVRRGIGCEEDVMSALLRLQQSCNHYGDCLTMRYLNTEAE
jgi:hypothetical protein